MEHLELDKFNKLVEDQFVYGGKKYALSGSEERESTDVLFDKHGSGWLFGTIDKYCFRYRNLKRERDLLKIACYMYILWLKRGYHAREEGTSEPIDTNVKIKEQFFNSFISKMHNGVELQIDYIKAISIMLGKFTKRVWIAITEHEITVLYMMAFNEWKKNYANVEEHDTDTRNEEKNGL